ncbi:MAG TPA: VWA domain-containing protein [Gordonia sp. (in: high G+C Gram-positive bacteria)]|uniref:VWA domain-containing protein n=1 Tax=unclassified Gordonia (in: high G+C Gram-positive bacteria) TaxID=2657482 RepID=UPI000FAADC7E|nr:MULTISPECIES: VWA domain-containing protein [unclassified Gordonia (in: high G+C Gram-positive bacteria)]RUP35368.1 MAG: VWA domain-containing protein [Gordonia sp. (in: high G+C Gram-positive bacteria)]HNP55787.1 VWA domain-containing protein [Gordonia sp. (in: high G+C Gram-positive bacteria)]HRC52687.1 VWA domain-containing protein [Gordonia sp. (in: high G+C Gram-positive bacteria)]
MLANPWWLLGLFVVAALVGLYVYIQRRRTSRAMKFANLEILKSVTPKRTDRFRHVPFAVLAVALVLLTIALAGPQSDRKVPRNKATVMLVMDVSRSMNATDVAPSRIKAAQEAAKKFATELTKGINLGLVSFAGTATTLVSPTPDHNATKAAVDKLQLDDKTATGEGIFAALDQIRTLNSLLGGEKEAPPAHIVLLSDGKQTVPESQDAPRGAFSAARKARERRVPISTISFGTRSGVVEIEGERIPVPVDDASLKKISQLGAPGGRFFTASSLEELNAVYSSLQEQIGYETTRGDDSHPWVLAGTILALLSAAGALLLNQRLP